MRLQLLLLFVVTYNSSRLPVSWGQQCSDELAPACFSDNWRSLECSIVKPFQASSSDMNISFHINQFK
jgi:hypothetical protein